MTYPKGYKPPYKPKRPSVPKKGTYPKGYTPPPPPPPKTYPKEDTSPTIGKGSLSKEGYLLPISEGYKTPPYYGKRSPPKQYSASRNGGDRRLRIMKLIGTITTIIALVVIVVKGIVDAIY